MEYNTLNEAIDREKELLDYAREKLTKAQEYPRDLNNPISLKARNNLEIEYADIMLQARECRNDYISNHDFFSEVFNRRLSEPNERLWVGDLVVINSDRDVLYTHKGKRGIIYGYKNGAYSVYIERYKEVHNIKRSELIQIASVGWSDWEAPIIEEED